MASEVGGGEAVIITTKYSVGYAMWCLRPVYNKDEPVDCKRCAGEGNLFTKDGTEVRCDACFGEGTTSDLSFVPQEVKIESVSAFFHADSGRSVTYYVAWPGKRDDVPGCFEEEPFDKELPRYRLYETREEAEKGCAEEWERESG